VLSGALQGFFPNAISRGSEKMWLFLRYPQTLVTMSEEKLTPPFMLAANISRLFPYVILSNEYFMKSNQIDLTYLGHLSDDHVYSIIPTLTSPHSHRIYISGEYTISRASGYSYVFSRKSIRYMSPWTSIKVHSTVTISRV